MFTELLLCRAPRSIWLRKRNRTLRTRAGTAVAHGQDSRPGALRRGRWEPVPGASPAQSQGQGSGRKNMGPRTRASPAVAGEQFSLLMVIRNHWATLPTVSSPFKPLYLPYQCFLLFLNKDSRKEEIHREK